MTVQASELHVVLGAGQVGPLLARELAASGRRVRMVSRTKPASVTGVEWLSGDVSEEAAAHRVCEGACVVYNCLNPMRYDQWHTLLPPLMASVRAALRGSGARLVVLDNLYMYGAPDGGVIHDGTLERPCSSKGALRARLAHDLFEAQARGEFTLSIARAADFFGPASARSATFHALFFRQLAHGRIAPVLGNPDLPHAHAYIPDVAHALFLLGTQPRASEQAWLLPTAWNGTVRALFERFNVAAGRQLKPVTVPRWLWSVAGLFDGELRGVPEMLHQWNAPLQVDDTRFCTEFQVRATPIEQAVHETLVAHGVAVTEPAVTASATGSSVTG